MTRPTTPTLLASLLGCLALGAASQAQTALSTDLVVSGLERPIGVTHAPGDRARLFIIEKRGRIRVVRNGTLLAQSFLDIDSIVGGGTSNFDERGLLGLTFHPDYQNNGEFFVNYTNNSNDTVVARYAVSGDPDVADAGSAEILMTIDQPQTNHNGGWIDFGPDGFLYVATGDGGGGDDDDAGHTDGIGNGQDITDNLLGAMLRIDVNGDDFPSDPDRNYAIPASNPFVGIDGDDEIWAYGLRNPWRNAFDRETGDLWIADVGQRDWEEVNFQPADSAGGENYGWRCREGMHDFNTDNCTGLGYTEPIHEYSHSLGCSITGGNVYRGCAVPDLRGTYFFADYCSNTIWSLRYDGGLVVDLTNRTAELAPGGGLSIGSITSFGEDADGEVYLADQSGGEIFKIVPADGLHGLCCLGDIDADGDTDQSDLGVLLAAYGSCDGDAAFDARADFDGNDCVDQADLGALLADYNCE
jgi:glucose/arabinose dehydrogenase